jgi:hypothetical protein
MTGIAPAGFFRRSSRTWRWEGGREGRREGRREGKRTGRVRDREEEERQKETVSIRKEGVTGGRRAEGEGATVRRVEGRNEGRREGKREGKREGEREGGTSRPWSP